ncbi:MULTISPECIES: hypothetical protein [Aerosakkonema]|uniref:hypothetical protein n=1 Tax=Aerosakkonema TaxID=1246629 RepID=UPI0035B9D6D3
MSREFTSLKRSCPICDGARSDCRQSNRTSFIHCRSNLSDPPGYTFLGTDKWGFGIWGNRAELEAASQQQREQWRQQREAQQKEQAERLKKLPSIEERNCQYRKLPNLSHKYLSHKHRLQLRCVRHLSEPEIDFAVNQRWFHSWERGMRVYGVSADLAGVKLKGSHTTLLGVQGIALAALDFNGNICGFQIASDDREKVAKYIWLSSANQEGNGPHLPSGELPLFVYRHPQTTRIGEIWLVEGALKPAIVALVLWLRYHRPDILVIGAAGGNFTASAKLLQQTIAAANCARIVFCPDAGATQNHNLIGQQGAYRRTFNLLERIGIQPSVAWWGQESKNKLDIDELLVEGQISQVDRISAPEFWAKCNATLETSVQANWDRQVPREISRSEWLILQADRQLQHLWQDLCHSLVKHLSNNRISKNQAGWLKDSQFVQFIHSIGIQPNGNLREQTPTQCSAIVPYKGLTTINYSPGNLPTFQEWVEMGCPKIIFQSGERRRLNIEAFQKGFRATLDRSLVGTGKSHDSGLYTRADFDLLEYDEEGKDIGGRIFIISADHKNPTTATVEQNSEDLISRHNGEDLDYLRLTPLLQPYRTRTPKGKQPDIPGNCPETDTFIIASSEKDATIFGGKNSPICQRCSLFSNCVFLQRRQEQLKAKYNLRAHIDSLGSVSHLDVAIVDEPGTLLKATKNVKFTKAAIAQLALQLETENSQQYNLIRPFIRLVWRVLSNLENIPQYGYNHGESLAILAGEKVDPLLVKFWQRYRKLGEFFEHPIAAKLRARLAKANPNADPWDTPGIPELEEQLRVTLAHKWNHILEGCQTPEQKQEAIKKYAVFNWLSSLLKVISGQDKYTDIQINAQGELEITRPSNRHRRTLSGFKFVNFLDATITIADLKRKTGIAHILEIEQKVAPDAFKNLYFRIVKGLGTNPKGTAAQTTWKRITAAIAGLIDRTDVPDSKRAIIGFKGQLDKFPQAIATRGYWFKDTRGNNRFTSTNHLINFGLPKPNLAAKAGEWHALTGEVVDPINRSGRYGAWYNAQVRAEIIQDAGRVRAHLRPDEQIWVDFLAGDAMTEQDIGTLRQKFPGCTVEIIDAYDLAPDAASKGEQKARGMIQVAWQMVKETGDASRDAIAKILKLSPGRVSQLAKEATGKTFNQLVGALVFLYKALKEKLTLTELDYGQLYIVEKYLPALAEDLENPAHTDLVSETVICTIENVPPPLMRQFLAATPSWVVCKLFGGLMQTALRTIQSTS